jgi:glycerol-3-phosphate O-acyltransferase
VTTELPGPLVPLEPSPARYGAAMAQRFGPLYYSGIGRAIGSTRLEPHAAEVIRQAARQGPVVYVLPRLSALDHLALNAALANHQLPLSVWAPKLKTLWWKPLGEAWEDVRYRLSEWISGRWAPDPIATGWVVRALRAGHALTWFVDDRPGWFAPRPFGFEGLVAAAELVPAVQIVPLMIVWDRAPDVSDPLVRFFLGKQGVPSLFRRWWRALRSADTFVHVGRPLDLHALRERVGPERLAGVLQRVLKRALRDERRLVHGPRLLPSSTMKQLVLDNPPMRELAISEAAAQGKDPVRVRREMSRHYDRIAANFSWTVIQLLHVLLRPLWTRVFSGVDVRAEDIDRIRAAMRDGSVVLVPCHKSHFDYVLMSWVMYDHDLIVPHVVAGMNLAVWPLSILLRGAGGFFVRRSFGDDKLFPAIFARYLRELLHQEYPVEFFIEGGRTRSGKLMPPKLGVLSMVLDAATVRSHGREVTLLPISLAYEQVAEEGAYARELGGEQKRPESMRELLKARSVLRRRFGRAYLRVAEPIRCGQIVDGPPEWTELPPAERKERLAALGQRIVHRIGTTMVLLPTSLLSVALLAIPRRAVRHSELIARVQRFDALFRHKGVLRAASLDRFDQAIAQALDRFVRDRRIEALEAEGERLWSIHPDQRIFLDFYKNQILHVLGPAGLAACALRPEEGPATLEQLAPRFEALRHLLRREFVWDPDQSPSALLQEGIDDLVAHGAVREEAGTLVVTDPGRIGEIYGLIRPLLEGYMLVLSIPGPAARQDIPASIQARTEALYADGRATRPESLSLVTLQNAVATLIEDHVLLPTGEQLQLDPTASAGPRAVLGPMVEP